MLLSLVLIGIAIGLSGAGWQFDNFVSEMDGRLRNQPASGEIHIVEIDARSIAKIDRWPWPRSNYGLVVDQLKRAGAASIAFDVDFSARSTPSEDEAFSVALKRAGGSVILPTFGQRAGGGTVGWTDALPIAGLREHANLAAVSVLPDTDGYVRRVPIGTTTDAVPRPSLAAMVAGVDGASGQDFPIDLAIDPISIPRHSFVDIRDGRFEPGSLAGKHIIVGATAIEMGDRYAVPGKGVIPGVVIQALAAETLRYGIPREGGWQFPLLLAIIWAAINIRVGRWLALAAIGIGGPALLFTMNVASHAWLNWRWEIAPAVAVVVAANFYACMTRWWWSIQKIRSTDRDTGMPNRFALTHSSVAPDHDAIVVAHIRDFDKLTSAIGHTMSADLMLRLRDRIAISVGSELAYRIGDRVLAWTAKVTDVEERLTTLRTIMLNPIEVAGRRLDVRLGYGVAVGLGSEDVDRVLAKAMLAATQALGTDSGWHLHESADEASADLELSLLGELDLAITRGEIAVVYQPKLCLRTDAIVSVEALVRWHHPVRGDLRPDIFIPLAERNGRIANLTLHVVRRTVADLLEWRARGHLMTGAVNLSAILFNSQQFLRSLEDIVRTSQLPPELLTFEITESAAMKSAIDAAAALRMFRDLGIGISIDDYGTGQSTLSYIKQLPVSELKIDRSFVQFSHENRSDGVLVRSTIDMAHELGLKVVAEGIETEECLSFLREVGCDLAQGYFIGRPMQSAELLLALAGDHAKAA